MTSFCHYFCDVDKRNTKVLIIQTASIGDVILATALAESLHKAKPGAEVHFLVKQGMQGLFKDHPYIHKVWVWEKRSRKYLHLLHLILGIRKERYHLVVNVQRFFSSGLITMLSGAGQRRGFSKNPLSLGFTHRLKHEIGTGIHETERNQGLLQGIEGAILHRPALYPGSGDREAIKAYTKVPFITVAPASLWFTKQFPVQRWVEFLRQVPSAYHIILLGAPSDGPLCGQIEAGLEGRRITDLSGKLSLLQSAELMKHARMNYVNDSAPLHLASSVNAPVRAVFCSTVPAFGFGPLSDDSKVIETRVKLGCRPCGLHGHPLCPEGHFDCAYTIDINPMISEL
jgi:heptosyltransferase-2